MSATDLLVESPVDAAQPAAETPAHLGIADLYEVRAISSPAISPDGESVAFVVTQAERDKDRQLGHIWLIRDGGTPRQLTNGETGESAPAWSPDGRTIAFAAGRGSNGTAQICLLPVRGGEARILTEAELGVGEFRWSPDGALIAFTAAVQTRPEGAPDHSPLVIRRLGHKADGLGRIGGLRSHLFVVDTVSGQTRQLTSGDHSVSGPAWSPDGRRIAFITARHDDRDLDVAQHLFVIDAAGGDAARLTPDGWLASAPLWTHDGDEILFVGAPGLRSLQAHLYAVSSRGGVPRDLLAGFDRNVMTGGPGYPGSMPALTADGRSVIFSARVGGCVHCFTLPLDGGVPQLLIGSDTRVVSGVSAAARDTRLVAVVASPESPGELVQLDLGGGAEREITELNAELVRGRTVSIPEARVATAPDGTEIESWLWRAPQPNGPLVLDIHGGPHNAAHPALTPLYELWRQEMVGRGWSVLAVNPRGSDGYGEAFLGGAIGGWGELDLDDLLAAVDDVVDAGIADGSRLAVTGYSYGGYMTSWVVGHTDRFGAAVAGGVVTDMASMYGTSDVGPPFLAIETGDHPHSRAALYARLSPLTYAERVTTPLLILHGEADVRCPVGQAEQLFASLRQLRREVELVLYPGASHLFIVDGRPSHIADYGSRIADWVTRHVPSPATEES